MAVSVAVSTMAEIPLRNGGRGDGHWRWSGGRRAGRRLLSVCGVWAVGGGRWAPDDAGLGEATLVSVWLWRVGGCFRRMRESPLATRISSRHIEVVSGESL